MLLICLLVLLCCTLSAAATPHLAVLPEPQQVRALGQGYRPAANHVIRVTDTPEDRFAARLLRDALREAHGLDCPIALLPAAGKHELSLGRPGAQPPTPPAVRRPHTAEGYGLAIGPAGARIAAPTDAGLFYGVQTLIQLAEQARRDRVPLPGVAIADWPSLGVRGRYIEGGQSAGSVIMTRANLEREIRHLARYKLNYLVIEMYNLAPFASFPACANANTLSLADWQYLVELAHRHHVTIMPSLQSCGQMYEVIWTSKEGEPYRETTAPGMLCPSRPENIAFLQGLYADLLRIFRYAPYLGVGLSEIRLYAWQDRYCPRCQARLAAGETYEDIYLGHVAHCAEAVRAAAKTVGRPVRPMMWADEFYMGYGGKRWEGIDRVPKDMVMGHWLYWPVEPGARGDDPRSYAGMAGLLERGFDVLFVSASFEFNSYLHDLSPDDPKEGKWSQLFDSGIYNIADQTRWAAEYGRTVRPGHSLGGVCATFSQHDVRCWDTTWYAYALQGEYAWGDPRRPLRAIKDDFTARFAAAFYGARTRRAADTLAAAYRDLDAAKSDLERNNVLLRDILGEYDIHDEHYVGNSLVASAKLIDEIMAKPDGAKTLAEVRRRAQAVQRTAAAYRSKLAALAPEVANTDSLHHLLTAAHKIENHAVRTQYLLDQQQALEQAKAAGTPQRKAAVATLAPRLADLIADTRLLVDEVDDLVPGGADTTGYRKALAELEGFQAGL